MYEFWYGYVKPKYDEKGNLFFMEMDQTNLIENMIKFNNNCKPKTEEGKDKK